MPSCLAVLRLMTSSKLRRLLDGEVPRLRALEDLVYVSGCPAVQMLTIHTVGHEATCAHKSTPKVYR